MSEENGRAARLAELKEAQAKESEVVRTGYEQLRSVEQNMLIRSGRIKELEKILAEEDADG